jgi:hypothetical protein
MKDFFKTSKLIIGMAAITLLVASCNKDQNSEKETSFKDDPHAYILKKTKEWEAKGIEAKNEVLTLEQFNEAMRQNGWPEVTKEEVLKAKAQNELEERTCGYSCSTWNALGDNNGDGLLRLADYVALRSEQCRLGGTLPACTDMPPVSLMTCSGFQCPFPQFYNNCALDLLAYGGDMFSMNVEDHFAMRDRLLGFICCNP